MVSDEKVINYKEPFSYMTLGKKIHLPCVALFSKLTCMASRNKISFFYDLPSMMLSQG